MVDRRRRARGQSDRRILDAPDAHPGSVGVVGERGYDLARRVVGRSFKLR